MTLEEMVASQVIYINEKFAEIEENYDPKTSPQQIYYLKSLIEAMNPLWKFVFPNNKVLVPLVDGIIFKLDLLILKF